MSMKSKMFALKDVFNIFKGKRLTKADMISGNTNYLGAINDNNGIREKIGQEPIFEGNCITINYNGSVGESFYQIKPFWASDDVNVLFLKDKKLTKNIAMYLITIIKANKYRFSYGRKWTLEKMLETEIPLPIDNNNNIDWQYMESFIKKLHHKEVTTKNLEISQVIDFTLWKEFRLDEVFVIKKSPNINASEITIGHDLNYLTRTNYNNGIQCKVEDNDYKYNNGNCITIGGESASIFYQNDIFISGNNITLLYNKNMNKFNGLFIVAVLSKEKYKYSYGRAFNKEHIENTTILLPTKNNKPDWEYMENYIKSLPYADRI
mgnify:CR=1 FL=1